MLLFSSFLWKERRKNLFLLLIPGVFFLKIYFHSKCCCFFYSTPITAFQTEGSLTEPWEEKTLCGAVWNHLGPLLLKFDALNRLLTKLSVAVLLKDMDTLCILLSSLEYLICFLRALGVVLVLLWSSSEECVFFFPRIIFSAETRTAISLMFHCWSILAWKKVVLFICVLEYCCASVTIKALPMSADLASYYHSFSWPRPSVSSVDKSAGNVLAFWW